MYGNNAWWLCHKYDVNYKIMQWPYAKSNACHDDDGGSCMVIYLGMAMEMPLGRYGGCFQEDIRGFMCDRVYRITGFGCTGEVCANSQGEKGQCTVPKRLAMAER